MDYFTLVAGDPAPNDPMEGVVTTWDRVPGGDKIAGMVDEVTRDFSLTAPEKSVPGLVGVYVDPEIARRVLEDAEIERGGATDQRLQRPVDGGGGE
jgi:hypothetical protein